MLWVKPCIERWYILAIFSAIKICISESYSKLKDTTEAYISIMNFELCEQKY